MKNLRMRYLAMSAVFFCSSFSGNYSLAETYTPGSRLNTEVHTVNACNGDVECENLAQNCTDVANLATETGMYRDILNGTLEKVGLCQQPERARGEDCNLELLAYEVGGFSAVSGIILSGSRELHNLRTALVSNSLRSFLSRLDTLETARGRIIGYIPRTTAQANRLGHLMRVEARLRSVPRIHAANVRSAAGVAVVLASVLAMGWVYYSSQHSEEEVSSFDYDDLYEEGQSALEDLDESERQQRAQLRACRQ